MEEDEDVLKDFDLKRFDLPEEFLGIQNGEKSFGRLGKECEKNHQKMRESRKSSKCESTTSRVCSKL